MRKILLIIVAVTATVALLGCEDQGVSNETSPLVFASQELDGVFNPFYATSGPDMDIVGMTQIGMLSSDAEGKVSFGDNEPVVALDFEEKPINDGEMTEYTFVLKNNLKFSDGKPLTIKDVLFNLYVYLDPVYAGSSTIYSTDIVGLKEYRTQTSSEKEQSEFEQRFTEIARDRLDLLLNAFYDARGTSANITDAQLTTALTALANEEQFETVLDDYKLAKKLFLEELTNDYNSNIGTADTYLLSNGKQALFSDVEVFLYLEGYIDVDAKKNKVTNHVGQSITSKMTKQDAIDFVYKAEMPKNLDVILNYWQTATNITDIFIQEAKDDFFSNSGQREFMKITGIEEVLTGTTLNGVTYPKPVYDTEGNVTEGNEVLRIRINGVDPKAKWNFAFSVAPMHYYSTPELCAKFDFTENFGVEYGSLTFMNDVVKDISKIGLPIGAGAYKATNRHTNAENVTSASFFEDNVVYFESNEHFVMGKPIIRKLRYKIISSNYVVTALQKGEIHFGEPSATPDVVRDLNMMNHIGTEPVQTNGYGYIGVNAGFIPELEVRQAIMHAMDTSLVLNYYPDSATLIHRSMSLASWAYPKGVGAYYPFDSTTEVIKDLLTRGGYIDDGTGRLRKNGKPLKLTFTVAGETTNHPAWQTMSKAAEILNGLGCEILVKNDINALRKLSNGELQVWAAAWGSTIDPDMYQVYHIDSKATSVNNWGYKKIKLDPNGLYLREHRLILELSQLIDQGRETLDEATRANTYKEALDYVMMLAVELPTYQRDDLFAFNKNYIDTSTFTPSSELTAYNGLINHIWLLSLKETK